MTCSSRLSSDKEIKMINETRGNTNDDLCDFLVTENSFDLRAYASQRYDHTFSQLLKTFCFQVLLNC